jgi:hypothetical protein
MMHVVDLAHVLGLNDLILGVYLNHTVVLVSKWLLGHHLELCLVLNVTITIVINRCLLLLRSYIEFLALTLNISTWLEHL